MKKLLCVGAALAGTLSGALAVAGDLDSLQNLSQPEFRALIEDAGAALSYKSLSPAESLGITGFDLSLAVNGTSLENTAVWEKASDGESVSSTLPLPTLRLAKGLPANIDIGAFYLAVPDSNVKLYGGELRWAFIEGGVAMPAVSIHGTYSKLDGVDQLDLDIKSLDLSISKGFTILTPYAGVGRVWTKAKPVGIPLLHEESISQLKLFAGLNINFGLPNIALEVDQTGDATSYGAKFGLRW